MCCDMPDANRLTIHVMAAVGEHELEMIAQLPRRAWRRPRPAASSSAIQGRPLPIGRALVARDWTRRWRAQTAARS